MQIIKHILSILMIVALTASLGALLASTDHSPDIISKQTGFIAPVIGPWSFLLPPHASKATPLDIYWKRVYTVVFMVSLTAYPRHHWSCLAADKLAWRR